LCMCVGTFPPSYEFENYLLHYILEKRDRGRGSVVDYARYCLRTLEAILSNGDGSGFVPSVEEILAYKDRPPILATIYLVDGNVITEDLPITPDLNVGKVLEMCTGWLDLRDPRVNTLGMFVYDMGETKIQRVVIIHSPMLLTRISSELLVHCEMKISWVMSLSKRLVNVDDSSSFLRRRFSCVVRNIPMLVKMHSMND